MKIALCFHGLCGGISEKRKVPILGKESFPYFHEEIISKYDVDVFMHSWTLEDQNEIIQLYQPKKYHFEEQRIFKPEDYPKLLNFLKKRNKKGDFFLKNSLSHFYSMQKANQLKSDFEKEQGFIYDLVIHSRFDLMVKNVSSLQCLNPNTIYLKDKANAREKGSKKDIPYFIDYLIIGSSFNIDKVTNIYENISKYVDQLISVRTTRSLLNHQLLEFHINHLKLDIGILQGKYLDCQINLPPKL